MTRPELDSLKDVLARIDALASMLAAWTHPPTNPPCHIMPGREGERAVEREAWSCYRDLRRAGVSRRASVRHMSLLLFCMYERGVAGIHRYGIRMLTLMLAARMTRWA